MGAKIKKYTYEEVKQYVAENSECELLSEEYRRVTDMLRFKCKCGAEFQTDFHHFLRQNQRQCPACGRQKARASRRVPLDEIKERFRELGCEYVSGEYTGRKSSATIRCRCGHLRTLRVNTALAPNFPGLCLDCLIERQHDEQRLTLDEVQVLAAAKGLVLLSDEYVNAKTPLRYRCSCGREFESPWDSVRSGKKRAQCDTCSKHESSGERAVAEWLESHGLEFERQKEFPGCGGRTRLYRFDFYIPSENTCIEFDGQQHYKLVDYSGRGDTEELTCVLWDTQLRDAAKERYCLEHGIRLIRIAYFDFDKISEKLDNMLIPR